MKKNLAFILLGSLLFRLWFALGYWSGKELTHDAKEYLELAANLNQGKGLTYDEHHTMQIESYGRAPGYPVWLALLQRIEPTVAWVRLAEVFLNLLSTYLLFLLGRELFHVRNGIVAFVIASFYVPLISLIPPVLSENLWVSLMLVSYWQLARARNRKGNANFIGTFFFLAVATLVRPAAVFLIPFYFVVMYRMGEWKRGIVYVLFYFLLLLPWNAYLFYREGKPVFVASEGGITLWTGTHPRYSGDGDLAVNPPVQKEYRELLQQYADKTPSQREEVYKQLAWQNVSSNPAGYLWLEAKKLFFWIVPAGASIWQTSLAHRITGILFYVLLLIPAILSFRTLSPDMRFFTGGILLSFTLMILVFFPQERFRIATLDPILILIASNEWARRAARWLDNFGK